MSGTSAGSGYDQLKTTGPVSLAGSLNLTFGAFTPTAHDMLFLINNTGLGATTGTFQYADNSLIGTFDGFNWYITYEANDAGTPSLSGGNDVAIYSAVPEPTTLALLGVGAVACSAARGDGGGRRGNGQRPHGGPRWSKAATRTGTGVVAGLGIVQSPAIATPPQPPAERVAELDSCFALPRIQRWSRSGDTPSGQNGLHALPTAPFLPSGLAMTTHLASRRGFLRQLALGGAAAGLPILYPVTFSAVRAPRGQMNPRQLGAGRHGSACRANRHEPSRDGAHRRGLRR